MIYNYTSNTYQFKQIITQVAMIIGLLSLIILFLGMISPVGKFTILQFLTVAQMAYFGALQF